MKRVTSKRIVRKTYRRKTNADYLAIGNAFAKAGERQSLFEVAEVVVEEVMEMVKSAMDHFSDSVRRTLSREHHISKADALADAEALLRQFGGLSKCEINKCTVRTLSDFDIALRRLVLEAKADEEGKSDE